MGDEYALPLVGNFDPPISSSSTGLGEPGGNSHTNFDNPLDVNADGFVTPLDAVIVINHLNNNGSERLTGYTHVAPFIDVNTDGFVAPIDPLLVVNYLNANSSANQGAPNSGEGEWAERVASIIFVEQTELKLAAQTGNNLGWAQASDTTSQQEASESKADSPLVNRVFDGNDDFWRQAAMGQQPVQAARPLIDDDSSEESEQSLLDQLAEENTEKGYVSDIDRLMRHLQ
jgi:hypothetical protein